MEIYGITIMENQKTDIGKELERLHHKVDSAMRPFSLMLGSRKYSPSTLKVVGEELSKAAEEIIRFVDKK
jgi:hypothetical protein